MSDKPVLTYFKLPARAFPIRVALFNALGKDGYVDERLEFPEFGAEKEKLKNGDASSKLKTKMGYLPQLMLPNGKTYSQSYQIARYAAMLTPKEKPYQLYPVGDPETCLLIDEIVGLVDEVLTKSPKDPDAAVMKTMREEYAAAGGGLHNSCLHFEARLKESGGPFFCGKNMSIADLCLWNLFWSCSSGFYDYVPKEYMDQFPGCAAAKKAIDEHPLLKAYGEAGLEP